MLKELIRDHVVVEFANKKLKKVKEAFYVTDNSKCKRQLYYELKLTKPSDPDSSFESINRMNMGKTIEKVIHESIQTSMIGEQFRVEVIQEDVKGNQYEIHGYIDGIFTAKLFDRNEKEYDALIVDELKSFYGYYQTGEYIKGNPKGSDVKQLGFYIWACKKGIVKPVFDLEKNPTGWCINDKYDLTKVENGGTLLYTDRADSSQFEFEVRVEGEEIWAGPSHMNRAMVSYGTIGDILERFDYVHDCVRTSVIPAPEFTYKKDIYEIPLEWQRIEDSRKRSAKKSSLKKKYLPKMPEEDMTEEQWKDVKVKAVYGDWQCKYCDFKTLCTKSQNVELGYNDMELVMLSELFAKGK